MALLTSVETDRVQIFNNQLKCLHSWRTFSVNLWYMVYGIRRGIPTSLDVDISRKESLVLDVLYFVNERYFNNILHFYICKKELTNRDRLSFSPWRFQNRFGAVYTRVVILLCY